MMILLIGKPSSDYLEIDEDWAPSLKLGYDMACTDLVKNRECHERLKAGGMNLKMGIECIISHR